jgi:cytochrome c-type biogenesis protein
MAGEAFLLASVIVSFLAGIVALAMPCCFSVLLPSYFASCFKRRTAIFRMTMVFTLGVAAVLLPIALGVSAISIYISLNHSLLFVIGGFFMLFLGIASLLGIQLMPMIHPNVNLEKTGVPTVFALGAFSGVASSCCAPVLAGILILTALTTSIFGAAVVGAA